MKVAQHAKWKAHKMLEYGFYNMDCMEGMKEIPDKYFDLAIVDPPYGIGADNFKNATGWTDREGYTKTESAAAVTTRISKPMIQATDFDFLLW